MCPWSLPQQLSWDSNPSWKLSAVLLFLSNLLTAVSCLGSSLRAASVFWAMSDHDCAILFFLIYPCFKLYFQTPQCRWFVFCCWRTPSCEYSYGMSAPRNHLAVVIWARKEVVKGCLHISIFFPLSLSCHASFHGILSQMGTIIPLPVYTMLWIPSQILLGYSLFKTFGRPVGQTGTSMHSTRNLGLFLVFFHAWDFHGWRGVIPSSSRGAAALGYPIQVSSPVAAQRKEEPFSGVTASANSEWCLLVRHMGLRSQRLFFSRGTG